MLARRLALTAEQQSSIETILAGRIQEIEAVRSDAALAPKARRATVRNILQVSDSKIESLLNGTQKQLYEQMKQARKTRMQQGGPPSSGQIQNQY
jgi:hypothetical protein